jgi:hypothetical protein
VSSLQRTPSQEVIETVVALAETLEIIQDFKLLAFAYIFLILCYKSAISFSSCTIKSLRSTISSSAVAILQDCALISS